LATFERADDERRNDIKAFGNYVRALRRNVHGRGKGKSLRQISEETGIPLSVLSRGERGLQDLRRSAYIERLAPCLGVHASIMKRVAALVTQEDVAYLRSSRATEAGRLRPVRVDPTGQWARVDAALAKLADAPPETVEALAAFIEFLGVRRRDPARRTG